MEGKTRLFYDNESGETISEEELFCEYNELFCAGETEETFGEYLWNCLSCNGGTLKEVTQHV